MAKIEILKIKCSDETELATTIFSPETNLKGAIMIGPATGIKRKFYQPFAIYLAENGYGVITYDNRGIGDSLNEPIKKSTASLQSWGELDMSAILKTLKMQFPNTKYHLIGNSAGGQLVGLMPNCRELSSMFNVACSTGSVGGMQFPFKWKAIFFLNIFIPFNNFLLGYTHSKWVGMGEPLPKMVAAQWRKWCNGKGYVKTDFGKSIKTHYYDDLDFPTYWLNATDDPIATHKNVADMIKVFPKIKVNTKTIEPSEFGLKHVGHMKFFNKKNEKLWVLAKEWLNRF